MDDAGIDMLLVGDSVAMVVHGHDTTLPITLDEMLVHCRAVSRGARRAFLVGDMPFGSVEVSPEHAVRSAVRMMKEGNMDAIKIEGELSWREGAGGPLWVWCACGGGDRTPKGVLAVGVS